MLSVYGTRHTLKLQPNGLPFGSYMFFLTVTWPPNSNLWTCDSFHQSHVTQSTFFGNFKLCNVCDRLTETVMKVLVSSSSSSYLFSDDNTTKITKIANTSGGGQRNLKPPVLVAPIKKNCPQIKKREKQKTKKKTTTLRRCNRPWAIPPFYKQ